MTREPEIVHIKGLAQMLDISPAAVKQRIHRRAWHSIPKPFRDGVRHAWRIKSVIEWIENKEKVNEQV